MDESLAQAQLPEVDVACVVVRSAISGGPGDDIVNAFLRRGTTVVQEHPPTPTSVIDHLFTARNAASTHTPLYALNSFYVNLPTVQNFLHCVDQVRNSPQVKSYRGAGVHSHPLPGAGYVLRT